MATDVQIGGRGTLFVGEDKTFRLEILDEDDVPVDASGWSVRLVVALRDQSTEFLLDKTATISGTYNVVRASNTQRAVVTVTDDEMNVFKAKTYRHAWKRMDAGVETVLAYGDFVTEKATVP